ncbi:Isopentenyl-diphosphate Delta-isomerase [Paenibacillus solanacearum]|uniref:Isopentenyl-diphosphate Delta-isomerase n=1 Tax=Paenibacillus solanacearum TaxID=2048548 RepID=A0A916NJ21_9BACL|nr:NUDIX domain-containing protein [Paenibacillus solanacearum]CAG7621753.1 Isopentenyl-diphosphate Delta-isomerase [Paenibacillus solanacearum]
MTKAQERFEIYDEQMNPIGTATRTETHARGYWHRTFQCWIWDRSGDKPALLFQERHMEKDTFPGLLDISSAGHLTAGEGIEDGVRELEEELGLQASLDQLVPCGIYKYEKFLSSGLIDREFCHVFVLEGRLALDEYKLQPDEVTGLYWMPLEDVRRLAEGQPLTWQLSGVSLQADGTLRPSEKTVSAADFVPHQRDYFEMILQAIEECRGQTE